MKDTDDERIELLKELDLAQSARERWIAGYSTDRDLDEILCKVNYKRMVKLGLSKQFDRIADVRCAMEWLNESNVGGDSQDICRSYAIESWERRQKSHFETDFYDVLSPD